MGQRKELLPPSLQLHSWSEAHLTHTHTHTLTHTHKSRDLRRLFSRRRNDACFSVSVVLLSFALLSISGPSGGTVKRVGTESGWRNVVIHSIFHLTLPVWKTSHQSPPEMDIFLMKLSDVKAAGAGRSHLAFSGYSEGKDRNHSRCETVCNKDATKVENKQVGSHRRNPLVAISF